ncbi:hypothetical protein U1Q18_003826 [Sarracenia purpurea var. burkii]
MLRARIIELPLIRFGGLGLVDLQELRTFHVLVGPAVKFVSFAELFCCWEGSRNSRTYSYESRTAKDKDPNEILHDGLKSSGHDFIVAEICAHPRHSKQMKPHQVEGFNFLQTNLVAENPGGCILAHAPGSGKTFMIISFMQSFLAKYPHAKPLVVLPRGILATWKKEFIRWQVEEIPLYDFYSVKADSRLQQLEVLKQWAGQEKKVYTYRLVAAESPEEDDHATCFRKEIIAKMWFEWNEYSGRKEFGMEAIDVNDCDDHFLESPKLSEDMKALYKRINRLARPYFSGYTVGSK